MRRLFGTVLCVLSVVAGIVTIPAQPASAHHVCASSANTPNWYNDKAYLVQGTSSYRCGWDQHTLRTEAKIQSFNRHTGRWVEVAYADQQLVQTSTVWATAVYDCAGLKALLRTHARGMALFGASWTDTHEVTSSWTEKQCYSPGGGIPLINN